VQPLKQAQQHAASPEIGKTCSKSQEALFLFSVSLHVRTAKKAHDNKRFDLVKINLQLQL
jgi:hypothetical protein